MSRWWTFVTALFVVVSWGGVSAASGADTYPDPTISVAVDPDACAGDPLPAIGRASVSGRWTVTYAGQSRSGTGRVVRTEFSTAGIQPGAARTATFRLAYDGGTVERPVVVRLVDCTSGVTGAAGAGSNAGTGSRGLLPDTGGLPIFLLVGALAAVVVGGAVRARRDR